MYWQILIIRVIYSGVARKMFLGTNNLGIKTKLLVLHSREDLSFKWTQFTPGADLTNVIYMHQIFITGRVDKRNYILTNFKMMVTQYCNGLYWYYVFTYKPKVVSLYILLKRWFNCWCWPLLLCIRALEWEVVALVEKNVKLIKSKIYSNGKFDCL